MKWHLHWVAVATAVGLMAACGGGSDEPTFSAVKVAGDSLADSGTFGLKFTVQGSAPTGKGSTPIWPELVAGDSDLALCPHYTQAGVSFTANAKCTNYAIGGGRINYFTAPTSPLAIPVQLQAMAAAGFAPYELVLVDGGGNDAADLIRAYLNAASDGGAAYAGVLRTLLDEATTNELLAKGAEGQAQAGGAYMQALAATFAGTIRTQLVAKGAARVAVLNMPDVTLTPLFRMVLASIAEAKGEAAATQLAQMFGSWAQAFNTRLASELQGAKGVSVVSFDATLKDMVARPAANGLTNVTTPACPATGIDGSGLPTYDFPTCTAAALSAQTPPAGATGGANWWQTYAFSDSFHPTPRGHEILADMVRGALR